jgi:hypothetical protein
VSGKGPGRLGQMRNILLTIVTATAVIAPVGRQGTVPVTERAGPAGPGSQRAAGTTRRG